MLTDTPHLREQLLAAVDCAEVPMATPQLVKMAPPVTEVHQGCHQAWHRPRGLSAQVLVDVCCGSHHERTRRRYDHEVYLQLRALERLGQIQRVRPAGSRNVYWAPAPGRSTVDVAHLEALWDLPAYISPEAGGRDAA